MVCGKRIDVDEGIVAIVLWFNRSGAKTLYSCQGDKSCIAAGTYLPYVCFSCSRKFFVKLTRLIEDFLLKNDDVKSLYLSEDWIWENGKLEKKHNISLINQNVKNRFTNFVLKNYGEWAGR